MSAGGQLLRYGAALSAGAVIGAGAVTQRFSNKDVESKSATKLNPEILKHGFPKTLSPGIRCYSNHCLEYDPQRRTPLWVAEHINASKLEAKDKEKAADRRQSKFKQDESLPSEIRVRVCQFFSGNFVFLCLYFDF